MSYIRGLILYCNLRFGQPFPKLLHFSNKDGDTKLENPSITIGTVLHAPPQKFAKSTKKIKKKVSSVISSCIVLKNMYNGNTACKNVIHRTENMCRKDMISQAYFLYKISEYEKVYRDNILSFFTFVIPLR